MAVAPSLVALTAALPFWRRSQPIFGNLVGTVVIFGFAIAMILREHVTLDRLVRQCLDDGVPCFPEPDAFTRYAIYAFIGLAEVILLFLVSLRVESRLRRRGYAPEWR